MKAFFQVLVVALVLASNAVASAPIRAEFYRSFETGYVAGKCGVNIEKLLKRAKARGADISRTLVGVITNGGYSLSVTHRRNEGAKLAVPVNGNKFEPGVANFYHHVILLSEGEVYDYDYLNSPSAPSLRDYIRGMFWDEPALTQYTGLERLSEREKYRIAFVPAEEYLKTMGVGGRKGVTLLELYQTGQLPTK